MTKSKMANRYSLEVRARAVRMVFEHQGSYETQAGAIAAIAPKIDCIPQTLSGWVKQVKKVSHILPTVLRQMALADAVIPRGVRSGKYPIDQGQIQAFSISDISHPEPAPKMTVSNARWVKTQDTNLPRYLQ